MTPEQYARIPWSRGRYIITCAFPPTMRGVKGYVCWPFAIRRDGRLWHLDHVPSGYGLTSVERLRDAKAVALKLIRATGGTDAWQVGTPGRHVREWPENVKAAIREVLPPLIGFGGAA